MFVVPNCSSDLLLSRLPVVYIHWLLLYWGLVPLPTLPEISYIISFTLITIKGTEIRSVSFSKPMEIIIGDNRNGDEPIVLRPIGPTTHWSYTTAHWSYNPLVLHPIGPTTHWSYNPLVLQPIGPTTHWSYSQGPVNL